MTKTVGFNPALERAIIEAPDDDAPYLAYGAWLREQGDPRGELIALQHDPSRAMAAAAFLETHQADLVGPLAAIAKDDRGAPAFTWKHGFIHGARLAMNPYDDDRDFEGGVDAMYAILAKHPSGRFLVELKVGLFGESGEDLSALVEAMVAKPPAALRALHLGDFEYPDETEMSWYELGDLSRLWPKLPRLRTLILQGASWKLGQLELPEVRRVELRTGGLSAASGDAIVAARIPAVEHLEVWFGDDNYGGDCTVDHAVALLGRTDLPALRRLGLRNAAFADELGDRLGEALAVPRLTHLDLSMSALSDDGARRIAKHRAALAHLEELDVSDTYLTQAGLAALAGCARRIVAENLREDDSDDRYVSVGE